MRNRYVSSFIEALVVRRLACALSLLGGPLAGPIALANDQSVSNGVLLSMEQAEEMPLIDISVLRYMGGFRLPSAPVGDDPLATHSFSPGPIAFNPERGSLFTVSHDQHQGIGEFQIPRIVNSNDPNNFAMATMLQNFRTFHEDGSSLTGIDNFFRITGMTLFDSKLVVNYFSWYDAPARETDTSVVFQSPNNLASSNIVGPFQIDGAAHASGWLTPIPSEWQTLLGGDHIAGHSHGSIVSRLSVGPPAHIMNVSDLTDANKGRAVPSTALLDFSLSEPLHDSSVYNLQSDSVEDILYNENGKNNLWTIISGASYGFIVPSTGTYMTLGYAGGFNSGLGYKITQTDGNLCPGPCSYDPEDNYNYYWLWKISDMLKVKNGILQASDLRPYAHGQLDTRGNAAQLKGAAYDPVTKRLYVSLEQGDTIPTFDKPPLILVYAVDAGISTKVVMPPLEILLDE